MEDAFVPLNEQKFEKWTNGYYGNPERWAHGSSNWTHRRGVETVDRKLSDFPGSKMATSWDWLTPSIQTILLSKLSSPNVDPDVNQDGVNCCGLWLDYCFYYLYIYILVAPIFEDGFTYAILYLIYKYIIRMLYITNI